MSKAKGNALDHTKFLSDEERKYLASLIERYHESDNPFRKTSFRDSLLIEVAMKTGIRAQELLNLRKEDLLLKNKTLFIRALKHGVNREMPLDFQLFQRLKRQVSEATGKLLFDLSYSQLNRVWAQYRPNQNKTFHCLRHTFAIWLFKKTKNLRIVQTALGHKDYQNTLIYLDFVNNTSELKKAILG